MTVATRLARLAVVLALLLGVLNAASATRLTLTGAGTASVVAPITWAFASADSQAVSNASSCTFSNVAIGTASSTRLVVVLAFARGNAGNSRTITGVTIGGNAATSVTASASTPNPSAILQLGVASGSTATIVVTANSGMSRCGYSAYALDDYLSATPTDQSATDAASGTSASRTISVTAGGVSLWGTSRSTVVDTTWTDAVEDDDQSAGTSFQQSSAHNATDSGSVTATASWVGSGVNSIVAASWR